jgi:polar amino acid transport system substrate-binding protein
MDSKRLSALATAFALAACVAAPSVAPQAASELAGSGKLRAAINYGNPVLARKDAATGELRGVTVDLSRELARRLGVSAQLVGYDTVGKLLAGLKANEWDVAYLAYDPERTGDVAFTAPYMEVEVTYAVPEKSDARDVSQVDRPGRRIAVAEKNAADLFLSRNLKNASLVRARDTRAAFALLKDGAADAFAANRQELESSTGANPGLRIVEGRFTTIAHAIGVPSHRDAAASYTRAFVEDAKRSGLVQRAINESRIRGVVVAQETRP